MAHTQEADDLQIGTVVKVTADEVTIVQNGMVADKLPADQCPRGLRVGDTVSYRLRGSPPYIVPVEVKKI